MKVYLYTYTINSLYSNKKRYCILNFTVIHSLWFNEGSEVKILCIIENEFFVSSLISTRFMKFIFLPAAKHKASFAMLF